MAEHNRLGKEGELLAVDYLKKKEYSILEINWSEKKYEIDIIAKHNNQLIFVEVKTRNTDFFGNPVEAVTPNKQNHLIEGANYYIEKYEIDLECRFDVIGVVLNKTNFSLNHIIDAFYPEG
ncbi:MAG: YraN family protein [Flavobacteriales bacterium]|nr:YraN family protein [Flavobacteriales bacterium]